MNMTRRETLALGLGATALAMVPFRAGATTDAAQKLIAEFTGGADLKDGGVDLTAPEIAENGNTVPIEVDAPGAEQIMVVATKNPTPAVVTFTFGKLAAEQRAATRIRLAGTQEVIAVAKLADGSFARASKNVKVTIGGCGG